MTQPPAPGQEPAEPQEPAQPPRDPLEGVTPHQLPGMARLQPLTEELYRHYAG